MMILRELGNLQTMRYPQIVLVTVIIISFLNGKAAYADILKPFSESVSVSVSKEKLRGTIRNTLIDRMVLLKRSVDQLRTSPRTTPSFRIKERSTAISTDLVRKPCIWDALQTLRGSKSASDSHQDMSSIPPASFKCADVSLPGFFADVRSGCQVFRRCDPHGQMTSYLCPIGTIFNQITLTCDYWYNVNCSRSADYRDYSNSRLYQSTWPLLDDCVPEQVVIRHIDHRFEHGFASTASWTQDHHLQRVLASQQMTNCVTLVEDMPYREGGIGHCSFMRCVRLLIVLWVVILTTWW